MYWDQVSGLLLLSRSEVSVYALGHVKQSFKANLT